MTRRILFMLLAFTAIILVGAVVPLTLNATSHDRNSFVQAAAATARTDAVLAQAELSLDAAQAAAKAAAKAGSPNHYHPSAIVAAEAEFSLLTIVKEARKAGDSLRVLTRIGKREINVAMPPGNWDQLVSQANQQAGSALLASQPVQPASEIAGSYVIVALPVAGQGALANTVTGTVLLARSTKPLDNEIVALWAILGSVAAAGLIAAALVAFGLARWVSRPLKGLDAVARTLADGDLASRAKVGSGPPELRRLGTTFNTMAGRLEALVHGNRAVIADVSHQLRTPLAALRLRLDLLAADTAQSDPATGHELAGALEELARLSRLVDGLLAVARAENVVPVPTTVDVAEVARERVVAWHPVADDRGITLEAVSRPRPSVLAWMGEGHLEQVLDNLIANALDALHAGCHVTVTTTATTAGAQITVTDDGPGMSAEDRERAFLRFSTSNPNGTGLGLAIVHRLVTSNGGTARLAETPGGGLTVILDFPGAPASTNTEAGSAPAQDFISI